MDRRPRRTKRIVYIQYTNPALYPPLEHGSQILASRGWSVLFLGIGALGADANAMRFADRPGIRVRQLGYCAPGWRQKLHYFSYAVWAIGWVLAWRPAWVYASDLLACPVGWVLSYLPFLRVIYHEHDSPDYHRPPSAFLRFALGARKKLAGRAALRVLPNEGRIRQFESEVGNRVKTACVWNCPAAKEASLPRSGRDDGHLWVLYHGTIGPIRVPLALVEALHLLPERVRMRFTGYETIGYPGYSRVLQERAEKLGIGHRLDVRGAVSRHQLIEECRRCDVGIAFVPKQSAELNERHLTGASNKAFDYLACGLPVLVTDLPDWRAMYVDTGVGLACDSDDASSIAAALRWLVDHPDEMREMGERGRRRILDEWNYERQFEPVLEMLDGKRA